MHCRAPLHFDQQGRDCSSVLIPRALPLCFSICSPGESVKADGPTNTAEASSPQSSGSTVVGLSGPQGQELQQEWHEALALLASTAAPQLSSYTPDTLTKLLWAVGHGGGRPPDAVWVQQAAEAVLGCCQKLTARQVLRAVESFAALGYKVSKLLYSGCADSV